MIIFGACINYVLVVQSLSCVWHFKTPWAAAHQASLSFTICREPAYCILSAALSTASSFRIWNSSTGILSLPEASVRHFHMTKVMKKEAQHTQRRDRASGVSLEILKHLPPKPESAYFLLCAFTYTSDFMGGCPPLPLSEKRIGLQLQLIIPGCDSV